MERGPTQWTSSARSLTPTSGAVQVPAPSFTPSWELSSHLRCDEEGGRVASEKTTSFYSQTKKKSQRFGNVCGGWWPHLFSGGTVVLHATLFWNAIGICPVLMSPLTCGFCWRVKEISALVAQTLTDRIIYSIVVASRIIQEWENCYFLLTLMGV